MYLHISVLRLYQRQDTDLDDYHIKKSKQHCIGREHQHELGKGKGYLEHDDEAVLSLRQWQHLEGRLPF